MPPPPSTRTPELRSWTTRVLPSSAVAACVVALVGLFLPAASASGLSVSVLAIPGVGGSAFVLFLAVTALPVVDLVRGRLLLSCWLVLAGAVGLAGALLVLAFAGVAVRLVRDAVDGPVSLGPGVPVIVVAQCVLVVLGLAATLAAREIRAVERRLVPDTRPPWLRSS